MCKICYWKVCELAINCNLLQFVWPHASLPGMSQSLNSRTVGYAFPARPPVPIAAVSGDWDGGRRAGSATRLGAKMIHQRGKLAGVYEGGRRLARHPQSLRILRPGLHLPPQRRPLRLLPQAPLRLHLPRLLPQTAESLRGEQLAWERSHQLA